MPKFLTDLKVELVAGSDSKWVVLDPLIYSSDVYEHVVIVPEGFVTDFASVPRLPFAYMLMGGCANEAAVVHDYLYSTGTVPKEVADSVFLEAMKLTGVAAWRRYPMYWAVSMFGGSHYKQEVVE
jgi:hypothetical protein